MATIDAAFEYLLKEALAQTQPEGVDAGEILQAYRPAIARLREAFVELCQNYMDCAPDALLRGLLKNDRLEDYLRETNPTWRANNEPDAITASCPVPLFGLCVRSGVSAENIDRLGARVPVTPSRRAVFEMACAFAEAFPDEPMDQFDALDYPPPRLDFGVLRPTELYATLEFLKELACAKCRANDVCMGCTTLPQETSSGRRRMVCFERMHVCNKCVRHLQDTGALELKTGRVVATHLRNAEIRVDGARLAFEDGKVVGPEWCTGLEDLWLYDIFLAPAPPEARARMLWASPAQFKVVKDVKFFYLETPARRALRPPVTLKAAGGLKIVIKDKCVDGAPYIRWEVRERHYLGGSPDPVVRVALDEVFLDVKYEDGEVMRVQLKREYV